MTCTRALRPPSNSARQFRSAAADGSEVFEWRRLGPAQPYAYEVRGRYPRRRAARSGVGQYCSDALLTRPFPLARDLGQLFSITRGAEARIATYDPTPRQIPQIGCAHAHLRYTFPEQALLRDALLALCLNRWIDWKGM